MQVHAALAVEGFCYAIHSVGAASDQPRFDTPSPRSDLSFDLTTWIFSLTDTGHNRDIIELASEPATANPNVPI